jgi:hypothetical protein
MRKNCHIEGCIYDDLEQINLRGYPLTKRECEIILILGASNTPVPSMTHLQAMLLLVHKVTNQKF